MAELEDSVVRGRMSVLGDIYVKGVKTLPINGTVTTNYVPMFTADNTIGNSPLMKNGSGNYVFRDKLVVDPSYSSVANSYNEGIRVNQASNGWAEVVLGGAKDSASGASSVWLIGRRGAAGATSGVAGDLTIEYGSSAGAGLTLSQTATTRPKWNNNSLAYTSDLGAAAAKAVDTSISDGTTSTNLPTSKAVYDYVASTVSSVYKPKGTKTWAQLLALTSAKIGDVYNISDKDPNGLTGQNWVCLADVSAACTSSNYTTYWDALAGTVDLSAYATVVSPIFTGTVTMPFTSAGFVKTSAAGVLSVDTTNYTKNVIYTVDSVTKPAPANYPNIGKSTYTSESTNFVVYHITAPEITAYTEGLRVSIKKGLASDYSGIDGSGALKLLQINDLDPIAIFWRYNSMATWNSMDGACMTLTYYATARPSDSDYYGYISKAGFIMDYTYDSGNDQYNLYDYGGYKVGATALQAYTFIGYDENGQRVPVIKQDGGVGTAFVFGRGVQFWDTSTGSANTTYGAWNGNAWHPRVSATVLSSLVSTYSFATAAVTDCIYLKGTIEGILFTPVGLTKTLPTYNDGYFYMFLGKPYQAYSSLSNQLWDLSIEQPIYFYADKLRTLSATSADAATDAVYYLYTTFIIKTTLPTASSAYKNKSIVVQITSPSTDFILYTCVYDGTNYSWKKVITLGTASRYDILFYFSQKFYYWNAANFLSYNVTATSANSATIASSAYVANDNALYVLNNDFDNSSVTLGNDITITISDELYKRHAAELNSYQCVCLYKNNNTYYTWTMTSASYNSTTAQWTLTMSSYQQLNTPTRLQYVVNNKMYRLHAGASDFEVYDADPVIEVQTGLSTTVDLSGLSGSTYGGAGKIYRVYITMPTSLSDTIDYYAVEQSTGRAFELVYKGSGSSLDLYTDSGNITIAASPVAGETYDTGFDVGSSDIWLCKSDLVTTNATNDGAKLYMQNVPTENLNPQDTFDRIYKNDDWIDCGSSTYFSSVKYKFKQLTNTTAVITLYIKVASSLSISVIAKTQICDVSNKFSDAYYYYGAGYIYGVTSDVMRIIEFKRGMVFSPSAFATSTVNTIWTGSFIVNTY